MSDQPRLARGLSRRMSEELVIDRERLKNNSAQNDTDESAWFEFERDQMDSKHKGRRRSYLEEGDLSLYTVALVAQRNGLKNDPDMLVALDEYLEALPGNKTMVPIESVKQIQLLISKALVPPEDWEKNKMKDVIDEECKDQVGSEATHFTKEQWRTSLFGKRKAG